MNQLVEHKIVNPFKLETLKSQYTGDEDLNEVSTDDIIEVADLVRRRAQRPYPLQAIISEMISRSGNHSITATGELIVLAAQLDLIDLNPNYFGSWDVVSKAKFEKRLLTEKHMPHLKPVKANRKNIVLGKQFNQHDNYLCMSVIQKQNDIPLKLDWKFIEANSYASKQGQKYLLDTSTIEGQIGTKPFYGKHAPDFRGRIYELGHNVSYQGESYQKASINFAKSEALTAEGYAWLKVDVANNFKQGMDKVSIEDKLDWVEHTSNTDLKLIVDSSLNWKEKAQFSKAVQVLIEVGPTSTTSHPVYLDAGASGLQIISVLTSDWTGCEITGLFDQPSDAYQKISEWINAEGCISTKAELKDAAMPMFYGSRKEPLNVLGEEGAAILNSVVEDRLEGAAWFLAAFTNVWNPAAQAYTCQWPDRHTMYMPVTGVNNYMGDVPSLDTTVTVSIEEVEAQKFGVKLVANITHGTDAYVLREMLRRLNYNEEALNQLGQDIQLVLEAREIFGEDAWISMSIDMTEFVDLWEATKVMSLEAAVELEPEEVLKAPTQYLRELLAIIEVVLDYKSIEVLTNHDAYGTHPNHCSRSLYMYHMIMSELVGSTLLKHLYKSLGGNPSDCDVISTPAGLKEKVRTGKYGIC